MHEQIAPATPGIGVLLVILVKIAQDVQPGPIVWRGLSPRAHPTITLDRHSPPHRPYVHALPGILEPLRVVLSVARASGRVLQQTTTVLAVLLEHTLRPSLQPPLLLATLVLTTHVQHQELAR